MMNKIRNLLRKIKKFSYLNSESPRFGTRDGISRDWRIVTFLLSTVAIVGIGFATYLFYQIQSGQVLEGERNQPAPTLSTINRQELSQVLDDMQEREEQFQAAQDEPVSATDPAAGRAAPETQAAAQSEGADESQDGEEDE